jgi:hypothetical protein
MPVEPAPHPPPAGVARLAFKGNFGTASWLNGYWLAVTGTPGPGDLSNIAGSCYAQFQTHFLGNLHSDVHLKECTVRYYDGVGSSQASVFADHNGGGASTKEAANVAMVISWQPLSSHKGGKPRSYLVGPNPDGIADHTTFTDVYVTGMSNAAADFLSGINGLSHGGISAIALGFLSFFNNYTARNPPVFNAYLGAQAQKRICTQRRRLGREIF